jgi:hypothetical protein
VVRTTTPVKLSISWRRRFVREVSQRWRSPAARREEGVGLVEEDDVSGGAGSSEDGRQRLLGLADVLGEELVGAEAPECAPQLAGNRLGRQRLAGAGWAVEEQRDAG